MFTQNVCLLRKYTNFKMIFLAVQIDFVVFCLGQNLAYNTNCTFGGENVIIICNC